MVLFLVRSENKLSNKLQYSKHNRIVMQKQQDLLIFYKNYLSFIHWIDTTGQHLWRSSILEVVWMEDGLSQQSLLSVPRKTSQNLQILKLVFQIRLQKLVKYMNISINFSKKPLDLKLILKIFNCIIGQKCLSCFSILINIHACIYKNV